jgi:polysaccharide export outer membrane protein
MTSSSGFIILRSALLALLLHLAGCASPATTVPSATTGFEADPALHPGDIVKITFPAAANLDTTQQIRRDGKLNLYLIGEIKAADRSPADLQEELRRRYSSQLVSSDVTVTVVSSSFTVFVTGAVLRPGKISPDRAITVLEAVMETGGFDNARADPKSVVVIRTIAGRTERMTLDLKSVLDGHQPVPFYLRTYDIVYVPEKFSFF